MAERTDVMISSTARDLPIHRDEAKEACLRQGMFPIMMEHLPASDADAIGASLEMVDEAEIYLGIFAFRYGYVPDISVNPDQISVTEMEYRRSKERGIERLIFIMSDDHDIKPADMERGEGAAKLDDFKNRLKTENIVNFFDSPADLRAKIIDSLSKSRYAKRDAAADIHPDPDIPTPPEAFIAHRYTLLPASELVGRRHELNLLTDWIAKPTSQVYRASTLAFVAIGGMGKSALTWKWFNEIAPLEMHPLAGRLWWSFYESNATMENFIRDALAYVGKMTRAQVEQLSLPEREDRLLRILDREPYLLALDGLERILIAYARMDAAYLRDDEYDAQTANYVAGAIGLPDSAAQSFTGQFALRKCADPRAGAFLRKLTTLKATRVLISTRLYPAELQMPNGQPLNGSVAVFLRGLDDDDALDLWRRMGVSGTREKLLALFHRFENYPLLIRALAGDVARHRSKPGDFDAWQATHADFTPRLDQLTPEDRKSHVLAHALRGLTNDERAVLNAVAAFRMPASYNTLTALLVKPHNSDQTEEPSIAQFDHESEMDAVLEHLEDRGLLGWDRQANRYDLHPIVRAVTWDGVDVEAQRGLYEALQGHFTPLAENTPDYRRVTRYEDLAPAVELYHALIGLGYYDDAYIVFRDWIDDATLYTLSAARQRAALLERLFPNGLACLPPLNHSLWKAFILNALALAYQFSGQPARAVPLYAMHNYLQEQLNNQRNVSAGLDNLSDAQRLTGALSDAVDSVQHALEISRKRKDVFSEASSMHMLGLTLMALGQFEKAGDSLRESLHLFQEQNHKQFAGVINASLAEWALASSDTSTARVFAEQAWAKATEWGTNEIDFIRAARVQGAAALALGDWDAANERLNHALARARAVNFAEEELPALIALASLARQCGDFVTARERLDEVWEAAARGPYPLFACDAHVESARLALAQGDRESAARAVQQAVILAEGCGYAPGLQAARSVLGEG